METVETKICKSCKIELLVSNFAFRKDTNKYRNDCNNCMYIKRKKYRDDESNMIKEKKKKYWSENNHKLKEKRRVKSAEYRKNNLEKVRESAKKWSKNNLKKHRDYINQRYKNDELFNINLKLRRRFFMAIKRANSTKHNNTLHILGCNLEFFKSYIENKFSDGMSWELVMAGEIHLDHIKPCSKFNLLEKEEQEKCFHYSNFQPLWAKDNLIKYNKY